MVWFTGHNQTIKSKVTFCRAKILKLYHVKQLLLKVSHGDHFKLIVVESSFFRLFKCFPFLPNETIIEMISVTQGVIKELLLEGGSELPTTPIEGLFFLM